VRSFWAWTSFQISAIDTQFEDKLKEITKNFNFNELGLASTAPRETSNGHEQVYGNVMKTVLSPM